MNFIKIYAVITGIVFLSMLTCGLWIRFSGVVQTKEGMSFHANLGVLSIIMGLILVVLVFIKK